MISTPTRKWVRLTNRVPRFPPSSLPLNGHLVSCKSQGVLDKGGNVCFHAVLPPLGQNPPPLTPGSNSLCRTQFHTTAAFRAGLSEEHARLHNVAVAVGAGVDRRSAQDGGESRNERAPITTFCHQDTYQKLKVSTLKVGSLRSCSRDRSGWQKWLADGAGGRCSRAAYNQTRVIADSESGMKCLSDASSRIPAKTTERHEKGR